MYVIFACFVENTLIIACNIQNKDISLYQQKGNKTTLKTNTMLVTEKLQNAKNQLAYTIDAITNHSSEMQAWELKEFQTLKSDYELEISELEAYIKENNL